MKNIAKKTVVRTKNFVVRNKGKIAFAAVSGASLIALRNHNEFLREHGLYDEYHNAH